MRKLRNDVELAVREGPDQLRGVRPAARVLRRRPARLHLPRRSQRAIDGTGTGVGARSGASGRSSARSPDPGPDPDRRATALPARSTCRTPRVSCRRDRRRVLASRSASAPSSTPACRRGTGRSTGDEGGYGARCSRARAVASMSAPANTVASVSGTILVPQRQRDPRPGPAGRAAAHRVHHQQRRPRLSSTARPPRRRLQLLRAERHQLSAHRGNQHFG